MITLDHRLFLQHDFALLGSATEIGEFDLAGVPCIALVPDGIAFPEGVAPQLAVLRGLSADQRLALLDRAEAAWQPGEVFLFQALLQSTDDEKRVAGHLRSRMMKRRTADRSYWIRLHDPRVFNQLRGVLQPWQLADLMGPVKAWTGCDPTQRIWWRQVRPIHDTDVDLAWSSAQWDQVFRIELVNRVLRTLLRQGAVQAPDPALGRRVDAAIVRAVEVEQLQQPRDQEAFAVHDVIHGERLFQHPLMRACLQEVRDSGASYVGGVAGLDLQALSAAMAVVQDVAAKAHTGMNGERAGSTNQGVRHA